MADHPPDERDFQLLFSGEELDEIDRDLGRVKNDHDGELIVAFLEKEDPGTEYLETRLAAVADDSPLAEFCRSKVELDAEVLREEDCEFDAFERWIFLTYCAALEEKLAIQYDFHQAVDVVEHRLVDRVEQLLGRKDGIPETDFIEDISEMFVEQWDDEQPEAVPDSGQETDREQDRRPPGDLP